MMAVAAFFAVSNATASNSNLLMTNVEALTSSETPSFTCDPWYDREDCIIINGITLKGRLKE